MLLLCTNLSTFLRAELPAQLQPLADKLKSDLATLEGQRETAVGLARQKYAEALSTAENVALAAGQLAVIAAITKEREAAASGAVPAEFPTDLPKTLQPARKTYLDTVARIAPEIAARQDKIGVEYIRALNGLQASANAELSKAISAEKLRFLSQTKATASPAVIPAGGVNPPPSGSGAFWGFAKPLKELVEIVPWVADLGAVKFKPHDKAVPDELSVTVSGLQIQIDGAKKGDTSRIDGNLIAHYGKLVLISAPAPQSGTLLAKAPYVNNGTRYGIALELTNGKVEPALTKLDENATYDWSVRTDGVAFIFEVSKDGKKVKSLQANTSAVKAFGFLSIVRYRGNKSDLIVTVNPSAKVKP